MFISCISTIPALLEQWQTGTSTPAAFTASQKFLNRSYCCLAPVLSASSALAKCVNMPSIFTPGSAAIFFTISTDAVSGLSPIRLIPVSTAIWTWAVFFSFSAASDIPSALSSSKTGMQSSCRMHSSYLGAATGPRIRISFVIPCFRSCTPSSTVATAYPHTKRSIVFATGTAPCP